MGLVTRPDRGRPTLHGWWVPVALRYIKWWGPAAHSTRFALSHSAPPTNPKSDLNKVRSQRREAATVITVGLTAPPPCRRTSPTLLRPSLPVRRTSPTERDGRILLDGALRWSVHSHPLSSLYHSIVRFIRFSTCSFQIQRTTRLDSTLDDLWDLTMVSDACLVRRSGSGKEK